LFLNTIAIAVIGTIGAVTSAVIVAYGFSRFRVPGKPILFAILVGTIILPQQVTIVPTYAMFTKIGWVGTWLPLLVPHFFGNAYNVFLLRQFFMGIPRDLDEAAMIDGASPLRILWSVIVPQSWPAIIAVCLFHFFFAWNDFLTPLVYLIGHEELWPISVGMSYFTGQFTTLPHLIQATAMMALALPVFIFFLAQRFFVQGVVVTGIDK
jgi:multiple sugar transport system permease protein